MNQPCSLLWRELKQDINFSVLTYSSLTYHCFILSRPELETEGCQFTWAGNFNFNIVQREKELIQDTTNEDPEVC